MSLSEMMVGVKAYAMNYNYSIKIYPYKMFRKIDVQESIKNIKRKLKGFDGKPTGDWSYKGVMDLLDEEFGKELTQSNKNQKL